MNRVLLDADLDYAYEYGVGLGETPKGSVEARAVMGTLFARLEHVRTTLRNRPIRADHRVELALEEELLSNLLPFYESGDV